LGTVARFETAGNRKESAIDSQKVGLGRRALVRHRDTEQNLALPFGIADRSSPICGLRPADLASEFRPFIQESDDSTIERVDPSSQAPQLGRLVRPPDLSHPRRP
jgi:hypothetical protein